MSIRNAAKAIILHENKVLLNRCSNPDTGEFFALPGGGQNQYETMEEAVVRECLEETGYTVTPEALVAVHEAISTNREFREQYPDYTHKIHHVFRCSLDTQERIAPTELDATQTASVWVDVADIPTINLYPARIHERFLDIVQTDHPLYLGSEEAAF